MTTPTTGTAARIEGVVLVLILLTVAGFAGAASFTHVHDWTMANSPDHTPGWFGWANAVISELLPIAALLSIRHRRRTGAPIGYPLALLIASAGLSLAAQLAVAKPGPSGWLLSAVPALAFMALVKLVLNPPPAQPEPTTATPTIPITVDTPTAEPVTVPPAPPAITQTPETPTPTAEPTPASLPAEPVEPASVPAHLLPTARFSAVQHQQATGRPITADELATRLNIAPAVAGQLLHTLNGGAR